MEVNMGKEVEGKCTFKIKCIEKRNDLKEILKEKQQRNIQLIDLINAIILW